MPCTLSPGCCGQRTCIRFKDVQRRSCDGYACHEHKRTDCLKRRRIASSMQSTRTAAGCYRSSGLHKDARDEGRQHTSKECIGKCCTLTERHVLWHWQELHSLRCTTGSVMISWDASPAHGIATSWSGTVCPKQIGFELRNRDHSTFECCEEDNSSAVPHLRTCIGRHRCPPCAE